MSAFDAMEVGAMHTFGCYVVTREECLSFAAKFDPQPFHLTDEGAAASMFGRLAASGWHTIAIASALLIAEWQSDQGRYPKILGGLGVDELRWLAPVYPDDILRMEMNVLDKRVSGRDPSKGILTLGIKLLNQADTPVFTDKKIMLVQSSHTAPSDE